MLETQEPRRLAAVGTGYFSQFHYDAWVRLDVDLVAVCSLNKSEAVAVAAAAAYADTAAFDDFETMLDAVKPDLVDIIAPPSVHLAFIEMCVARGIPAICQKPFTRSLIEAKVAVQLAEDADVPLFVHENFRFQPWHIKIKEMLDAGRVGKVYQATFRLRPGDGQGPAAYRDRQPYFHEMERFLVHETAIHFIDVFRNFFGEIETVTAELTQLNPHIAGEDAGLIIMNFENGVRALLDGNRLSDHIAKDRRQTIGDMWVEGSKGTIRLSGDGQVFFRTFGANAEEVVPFDWEARGFAGDSVYRTQKQILDHLTSRSTVVNTGGEYLANLRAGEAVYKSSETGRRISLT